MSIPALREIIEERKGKVIEALSAGFAKNKLPLEEYERLVEYINKIESERELIVVEKIAAEYGESETRNNASAFRTGTTEYYNRYDREDEVEYESYSRPGLPASLSILSSRTLTGPVKTGAQYVSILGSNHIKIRKADLNKWQTILHVVSILGDCVIFVEPGIKVHNRAIPILGGAWTDSKVSRQEQGGEPEIIISGAALLGNITVKLLME